MTGTVVFRENEVCRTTAGEAALRSQAELRVQRQVKFYHIDAWLAEKSPGAAFGMFLNDAPDLG